MNTQMRNWTTFGALAVGDVFRLDPTKPDAFRKTSTKTAVDLTILSLLAAFGIQEPPSEWERVFKETRAVLHEHAFTTKETK